MSPPLRHRADSPESGLELLAKIAHVQAQINVFERTQQQSRQQQEPQRVGHGAQVQEAPRDSNAVAADGVVPAIDEDDTTTSSPAAAVSSRPGYLPSTARAVGPSGPRRSARPSKKRSFDDASIEPELPKPAKRKKQKEESVKKQQANPVEDNSDKPLASHVLMREEMVPAGGVLPKELRGVYLPRGWLGIDLVDRLLMKELNKLVSRDRNWWKQLPAGRKNHPKPLICVYARAAGWKTATGYVEKVACDDCIAQRRICLQADDMPLIQVAALPEHMRVGKTVTDMGFWVMED